MRESREKEVQPALLPLLDGLGDGVGIGNGGVPDPVSVLDDLNYLATGTTRRWIWRRGGRVQGQQLMRMVYVEDLKTEHCAMVPCCGLAAARPKTLNPFFWPT